MSKRRRGPELKSSEPDWRRRDTSTKKANARTTKPSRDPLFGKHPNKDLISATGFEGACVRPRPSSCPQARGFEGHICPAKFLRRRRDNVSDGSVRRGRRQQASKRGLGQSVPTDDVRKPRHRSIDGTGWGRKRGRDEAKHTGLDRVEARAGRGLTIEVADRGSRRGVVRLEPARARTRRSRVSKSGRPPAFFARSSLRRARRATLTLPLPKEIDCFAYCFDRSIDRSIDRGHEPARRPTHATASNSRPFDPPSTQTGTYKLCPMEEQDNPFKPRSR